MCKSREKKNKTDMAIAKYKAKREAWLENEGLKMDREKLDLERERLKRDLGHSPKTKRAIRDYHFSYT